MPATATATTYTFAEARLRAAKHAPYLALHIMSLVPVKVPGLGTFANDAFMRCYYDPAMLSQWTLDECAGVILHEDLHAVLAHCKRATNYLGNNATATQLKLWNIAADIVVNSTMRDGKIPLPEGAIFPERYGFTKGLTVEDYYALLEDMLEQQQGHGSGAKLQDDLDSENWPDGDGGGAADGEEEGEGDGSYSGKQPKPGRAGGGSAADGRQKPWEKPRPEDCPDVPGMNEHEQEMLRRSVAKEMDEHKKRTRGNLPGDLERWVDEILRPKTDPAREIAAEVKFAINSVNGFGDFTWKRLPRRSPPGGVRLPAHVQPVPSVVLIVDTSGSMDKRDLGLALGVIGQVVRTLPHEALRVITGDTCAQATCKVFRPEQVQLLGGGGTDMDAIIRDVVEKARPRPDVVLCITDGYTPWPREDLGLKVVACITREESGYEVPEWIKRVEIRPEREPVGIGRNE
jgi:predicted metal-dependent peptidase